MSCAIQLLYRSEGSAKSTRSGRTATALFGHVESRKGKFTDVLKPPELTNGAILFCLKDLPFQCGISRMDVCDIQEGEVGRSMKEPVHRTQRRKPSSQALNYSYYGSMQPSGLAVNLIPG
jgi:hypothetical protein